MGRGNARSGRRGILAGGSLPSKRRRAIHKVAGSHDIRNEVKKMSKTTVELDEAKVSAVREVLGTRTLKDTIDRAFDTVLANVASERLIRRLQQMDGLELDDPTVMESAWR
jgi:Arc/MetJ family transcription regulator